MAEQRPATVLELLERTDAFRRPERFERFLLACEADARGRGPERRARPYPQADLLRQARAAAAAVKLDPQVLAREPGRSSRSACARPASRRSASSVTTERRIPQAKCQTITPARISRYTVNGSRPIRSMKRIRKWMQAMPDSAANATPTSIGSHCTGSGDVTSLSPS